MPRDMFGDVVDPSIKMGNKMWYTVPLTMLLQATIRGGHRHRPVDGRGGPADDAIDDGVRGRAAAATTAPAASAAAGCGCAATAAGGRQPERGARRGPKEIKPETGLEAGFERASAVSKAASSAVSPVASPAAFPNRRRHRRRRPRRFASAATSRPPQKIKRRQPGLPADRAVGSRPGRRHHRGHDRPRWRGEGREGAALDSPAGCRRRSTPFVSGSSRRPS